MRREAHAAAAALLLASSVVAFAHAAAGGASSSSSAALPSDGGAVLTDARAWNADAAWVPRVDWLHLSAAKYRRSLVDYAPKVRAGHERAFNESRTACAYYLNAMHNRMHLLFTDRFLVKLAQLDAHDPLNDRRLVVRVEIVLDERGRVDSLGVVRSSGLEAFDLGALESIARGAPYGDVPAAIRSSDGKAYVHWEFHRDDVLACSTMNARPYLLAFDENDGAARDAAAE